MKNLSFDFSLTHFKNISDDSLEAMFQDLEFSLSDQTGSAFIERKANNLFYIFIENPREEFETKEDVVDFFVNGAYDSMYESGNFDILVGNKDVTVTVKLVKNSIIFD